MYMYIMYILVVHVHVGAPMHNMSVCTTRDRIHTLASKYGTRYSYGTRVEYTSTISYGCGRLSLRGIRDDFRLAMIRICIG